MSESSAGIGVVSKEVVGIEAHRVEMCRIRDEGELPFQLSSKNARSCALEDLESSVVSERQAILAQD